MKRTGRERAMGWGLATIASVAVVLWPIARQLIDRWERPAAKLAPGVVLVATTNGTPAPFERAVVLLLAHDAQGASGVVVNRLVEVGAAPQEGAARPRRFAGGPVETERPTVVWRSEDAAAAARVTGRTSEHGHAGAFDWSRDAGELPETVATPGSPRAYFGRADWTGGQLEREVAHGAWLVADARSADVLGGAPGTLWSELVARDLRRLETVR